jgi:hypothetical protein
MTPPPSQQLAAAVAQLDAEIAGAIQLRQRLQRLVHVLEAQAEPPPIPDWHILRRANARLVRPGLIQ